MIAAVNGYSRIVRYLIDGGAVIDMKDNKKSTELMLASENGHIKTVQVLIDNVATDMRYYYERTALMLASKNGKIKTVKALLHQGAFELF